MGMLTLLLVLASLIGLPALSQVGRVLIGLLARMIGLGIVMALALIVLAAIATHGKVL